MLLPLEFVLPKAKAPSPAKGVSAEGDKTKSSADESGDGEKSDNDDGAVPVDTSSAGYLRFKVEMIGWVPLVLVLGAMI